MSISIHRSLSLSLFSVLCSATLAGCSLIKVKGVPGGGTASPTASPAAPAADNPGGGANTPAGADPELVKLFLAVSWKDFDPTGYVDAGVVAKSGLKLSQSHSRGPRMGKPVYAVTPDATWLPGWNPRKYGNRDLPFQVAQAGINRTWQAQCFQDYAAYRAGWTKLEATFRPQLEEVRAQSNTYARAAGLQALYASISRDAKQAGIEIDARHPAHWIGLRWEVSSALLSDIVATKRTFVQTKMLGNITADIKPLLAHGRAWSTDAAFERDAFCAAAQDLGTQSTPKLPRPQQGWALGPVAFPVSGERKDEVTKKVAELIAADRPQLDKAKVEPADPLSMAPPTTPVLATFNPEKEPLVIERVQSEGDRTIIVARSVHESQVAYDCVSNGKIESFNGDQPVYGRDCKTGTVIKRMTVQVTFDELPPDTKPSKGDAIRFYGDVVRLTSKETVKGPIRTYQNELEVTGRYLVSVNAK